MISANINGIKMSGLAIAVSNNWNSLSDLYCDELGEKTVDKFTKTTGVIGRYDAGKYQTSSDFCFSSAEHIIKNKNLKPEDIGILVYVTMSPDYLTRPATACVLQYRLGIPQDCIAFDVNLGCSGFVYGLNIVSSLMKVNHIEKGLLLCGDTTNKNIHEELSKSTNADKMLYGDAGAAVLLEQCEDKSAFFITSRTDGSGFKAIINPYRGYRNPGLPNDCHDEAMNEFDVFNFSTSEAPLLINETMSALHTTPDDYDCLVLHQANLLIMKRIAKKTGFDMKKILVSIDEFGNTSSASIPVSLAKAYGGCNDDKQIHMLMSGYGVGLSWGVVDAYINIRDIFPVIHTDYYFDDGYGTINSNSMGEC